MFPDLPLNVPLPCRLRNPEERYMIHALCVEMLPVPGTRQTETFRHGVCDSTRAQDPNFELWERAGRTSVQVLWVLVVNVVEYLF